MAANASGSGKNIRNAQWAFLFLIVGFVVLLIVFALSRSVASGRRGELPAMENRGLQYATNQAQNEGFEDIKVHDALGRDRHIGDGKDWVICFQTPAPGRMPRYEPVVLGAVEVTETCPTTDQGAPQELKPNAGIPDLRGQTAWWVREKLGPDASIRFIDISDENHEINGNLGDWKVCVQSIPTGTAFNGEPLLTIVTRYDETCTPTADNKGKSPGAMMTDLLDRLANGDLAEKN